MRTERYLVSGWGPGLALLLFATGSLGVACGNGSPAQTGGADAAVPPSSTGTGGGTATSGAGGAGGTTTSGNAGSGGTAGAAGGGGSAVAGGGAAGTGTGAAGVGGALPPTAAAPCPQPSPNAVWTPVPIQAARAPIDVTSSWAADPNDAWLIGAGVHTTGPSSVAFDDQVQHWNGQTWTTTFDGFPTHVLLSVYGFGASDVWATGDVALHWNGSTWTNLSPAGAQRQPLRMGPVWGLASNDVWAGNQGTFLHWNGTAWTDATVTPPIFPLDFDTGGIWGATSDDVWALGGFPASHDFLGILRWNGTTWNVLLSPQQTNYTSEQAFVSSVWGAAANDIWAVGFSFSGSQIWHYDGTAWTHVAVPTFNGGLSSVWGFCASDVWAVGDELPAGGQGVDQEVGIVLHFDGTAWSRVALGIPVTRLFTVSGVSTDDLWVGGANGTMVHRHH